MPNRRSLALRRNDANAPLRPGPVVVPAHLDPAAGTVTVPYTAGTGVTITADPPGAATYWRVVGANVEIGRNAAGTLYTGAISSLQLTQTAAAAGTDVLLEPFNNFTAAPWVVTSTPAIVAGRTGTAGEINSISDRIEYNIPAASQSDTVTIGFAWRTPVLQPTHEIVHLRSDAGATLHTQINTNAAGALVVARFGTQIAISANGLVAANTWYFIEVQVKLHDTTGFAIVRLNGTTVINASALDTKNAGTKTVFDQIRFSTPNASSGGTNQIDDLYLKVGAGASFKGDITIPPAVPTIPDPGFRFDAAEYPGTGLSYTDPRGDVWTLSAPGAIVPQAVTTTTASLYDSALRSDFTYIPEDLDPPQSILVVRDVTHTSVEVAFDPLKMPVDPNFGAPTEIALVRSPSGFPVTLLDGTMVRRHPPTAPDNDGWVRIPDTGLTPGTWYYYGLFVKYFSSGNTYWLRIGQQSVLLPAEYLSADHLWERIPEWYRRSDMEPGDKPGMLRRWIDVIGYQTDAHRTWALTVGDVWDAEKISSDLLPHLGDTLGQPVEYAAGDERYRALLSRILPLRKLKGTELGTEAYLSTITGYRTRVYAGLNSVMTLDDAEATYSNGLWLKGGTSTLTRVLSTGAASPGPAAGTYYHRLTFNGTTSQQPWMQLGASGVMSQKVPVTAGHQYATSAFFRSSFTGTLNVTYTWFNALGVQVGANAPTAMGAIATGWIRRKAATVTAPVGASFVEISFGLSAATNTDGLVIEITNILIADLAWRPEDVPGSANTPPLSGTHPGFYDDVGYYESPRTVHINVYPQRINYALNSEFRLDNLPAGAWTVAERATWGLLRQAYDSWGDIHDAQPGDSEADWGDLAEGFEPLSGDWSITFETASQRLRLNPAGAPSYVAQVQSHFIPVVPGDSLSAAFISWATVAGVPLTLAVQFYTAAAPQYPLTINGAKVDVIGAPHALTTTPYRYELRNAVIPEGAAFARVAIETHHTVTYNAYLQEALIENAQVPGSYFNGDEVDAAFGDFFFLGLPHETYSVYYQNYRSFINSAGGSDRITTLMDELLPMGSKFVLRTAAFGLY